MQPSNRISHKPWCPFSTQLASRTFNQSPLLTGDGRVSYTDRNENTVLYWSLFHCSDHEFLRFGSSHRIQVPWLPSSAAFHILTSSTYLFTSPCTMLFLSVLSPFAFWWKYATSIPFLPVQVLLSMSISSRLSAWATAVMADHLQPDLVWTPASRTFWFNESRSVNTRWYWW